MKPVIDSKNIEYVSKLARIHLNKSELEKFTPQISKIIDYINKLNELDTEDVLPTTHVVDLKNVLRKDIKKTGIRREDALKNAPESENGFFKVPKII
jgi:aspartyl-tRNA(Asn)/glutamyl-tRNA(Gln) amidotransferase subunit C